MTVSLTLLELIGLLAAAGAVAGWLCWYLGRAEERGWWRDIWAQERAADREEIRNEFREIYGLPPRRLRALEGGKNRAATPPSS